MSNPDTTAPSRRAVAIACRPATPAPITSTLAGATVPAAVISMGKNFGSRSAASSTALYPPTVLCEDKASIDCARVMRGIDSIAKPMIPRSDRRSIPSLSVNGSRKEISATPSGIAATSSALGLRTRTTTSAPEYSSGPEATVAPASR